MCTAAHKVPAVSPASPTAARNVVIFFGNLRHADTLPPYKAHAHVDTPHGHMDVPALQACGSEVLIKLIICLRCRKTSRTPKSEQRQRPESMLIVRASKYAQQLYECQQHDTNLQHVRNPGLHRDVQKRILQHGRPVVIFSDHGSLAKRIYFSSGPSSLCTCLLHNYQSIVKRRQ